MGPQFLHRPVMGREVVELLTSVPPGVVVDATVGGGGHARLLLESRPDLRVLGIDRDRDALAAAHEALADFGDRARVVQGGFEELTPIVGSHASEGKIVGILFDLGVSSPQLDRAERGFSYWADAPLDMRMDNSQPLTAAEVVNRYSETDLARLIRANGEERFADRIARGIVERRPLSTTGELVDTIKDAIPARFRRRGGHPARRTFQAIRMEVNRELPSLSAALDESVHLLTPGGRVLVVAYHSLEDRMVKERFRSWAGIGPVEGYVPPHLPRPVVTREPLVKILTRRPLRPSEREIAENPRAKSAKLRAAEKRAVETRPVEPRSFEQPIEQPIEKEAS
ncbi:MAG TPA: 16S rRNA (cytosine(1402)-N(4))-methyltransferase RsmH [Acidimicrobiia bacterium]|nr:16S rRNA (cytosine(1402)-N(4))-methyltransferase RsmH [Acidimicrobiia bacterium]